RPEERISPGAGDSLSLAGRRGSRALGGDFEYRILTAQTGAYLRMPWARHHVLALLASAGTSGGEIGGRGIFSLGGPPHGSSAIDTQLRLDVHGESLLRGYPQRSFVGSEFLLGSIEYRFALFWLDAAPGRLPLYLGKTSATIFADARNAFDRWPPDRLYPPAGAERRLAYHLGWGALDGALRLGAAWGFDRAAGGGPKIYFGLGAYFESSSAARRSARTSARSVSSAWSGGNKTSQGPWVVMSRPISPHAASPPLITVARKSARQALACSGLSKRETLTKPPRKWRRKRNRASGQPGNSRRLRSLSARGSSPASPRSRTIRATGGGVSTSASGAGGRLQAAHASTRIHHQRIAACPLTTKPPKTRGLFHR